MCCDLALAATDIAIKVQDLSKCYHIYDKPRHRLMQMFAFGRKEYFREFWALKNISFEIRKGETVGIIGKNGAGKSTLLQILAGTLAQTAGKVEINGRLAALLELGSGFNPEFTGRENIYLSCSVLGLSREETDARLDDILSFADIGDFIDQPVKTYSTGMYVRLAFSIQANISPEILIVDEALAVGDAYFVHKCMLRFADLQKTGTTIILVTHDATAVRQLCDRAIWIEGGSMMETQTSTATEVIDRYLANLFSVEGSNCVAADESLDAVEGHAYHEINSSNDDICKYESYIPNVDQRFGNRVCEVMGIGVYDRLGHPINSTNNDTDILLRVTVKNNHPESSLPITVGYTFRNMRGIDISSSDTIVTNTDIGCCAPGGMMTVSIQVTLPILHPGAYSIIPSAGYFNKEGVPVETDRIINAVVIEVNSDTVVNVGMRFKSEFRLEA